MAKKLYSYLLVLLLILCAVSPNFAQSVIPVSPYNFPFGYPFPDYPVAGASHPSLSNDYMSDATYDGDIKRVAQYALRLLQTDRAAEALDYGSNFTLALNYVKFPGFAKTLW